MGGEMVDYMLAFVIMGAVLALTWCLVWEPVSRGDEPTR